MANNSLSQADELTDTLPDHPRSKLHLWTVLIGVATLTCAVLLIRYFSAPKIDSSVQWIEVKRADFPIVCLEEGELHPVQVTTLTPQTWGSIGFIVPDGSHVKKGEKVFSIDTRQYDDKLKQFQDELATAELNRLQQIQLRDLTLKQMNTDLASTREQADVQRLNEKVVLEHPWDNEKENAENILAEAKTARDIAQHDLESTQFLYEHGVNPKIVLDAKVLAFKTSDVDYKRAQIKAKVITDGALPNDRERAAIQRENAELTLSIAELDLKDQESAYNLSVTTAEHAVVAAKSKLERCQHDLENCTVRAPHDGVVVYRIVDDNTKKKAEVGDRVNPWKAPIDLPCYDRMIVRTQVPESFVRRLRIRSAPSATGDSSRPGSEARVRVKTLPGKVYDAEVVWIDGWARDRNQKLSDADIKAQGLAGVRVFDVKVELKESDPEQLRDGFQATVEFPSETLKDVITIPMRAVIRREGGPMVQVVQGQSLGWRKVELGELSAGQVVIVSGLSHGEKVVVPQAEEEPSKVTPLVPKSSDGGSNGAGPGGPGGGPGRGRR
jgi:HlyD family secretion protein